MKIVFYNRLCILLKKTKGENMNKNIKKTIRILTLLYFFNLISCPKVIFITRHAEKTAHKIDISFEKWNLTQTKPLSTRGWERAYGLVPLFTMDERLTKYGHVSALFAPKPNDCYNSVRPIQTLTPLAKELILSINTEFELCKEAMHAMVHEIMHNHKYHNKTIWIAYEHKHIPELANMLQKEGMSQQKIKIPHAWPNNSFDRIWVLEFDTKGVLVSFQNMPQKLLIHDSDN
jgi:hypothetical protein